MNLEKITHEALKLSPKERANLALAIWESLGDPFLAHSDLSEEDTVDLATKRDFEIERGVVDPIAHNQLMKSLRG